VHKLLAFSTALIVLLFANPSLADYRDLLKDTTPVERCDAVPTGERLLISHAEEAQICSKMQGFMQGIRAGDVYMIALITSLLIADNYENGDATAISGQLLEIIQLRGLYDQPDQWQPNLEMVLKSWQAFHGNISPRDVKDFLVAAGPDAAKNLSLDGFGNMIAVLHTEKQQGN
jgi:hypothetical protein